MFRGDEPERRSALLRQACRLAVAGVDYLQVREKDLPDEERIKLAAALCQAIASVGGPTKVLLSGPPALAHAAGADGAHLTSSMLYSSTVGESVLIEGKHFIVSASCHTLEEVALARMIADLILFSPVYEKRVAGDFIAPGTGLLRLQEACLAAAPVPVLALGGVKEANTPECLQAGAVGYASIRAFLPNVSC